LLLIALAALWLALLAFVVTMCRLAARSDEAQMATSTAARRSRSVPRKLAAPHESAADGQPLRSGMRVE
jgi:hypothetical protein